MPGGSSIQGAWGLKRGQSLPRFQFLFDQQQARKVRSNLSMATPMADVVQLAGVAGGFGMGQLADRVVHVKSRQEVEEGEETSNDEESCLQEQPLSSETARQH